MLRSELFETNVQCTYMAILCLLEITQISVYSTQVVVRSCDIYMVRSEVFHINVQCTCIVVLCMLEIT